MSGGGDDGAEEKEHEPTQRKLDEARKRGEVTKSTDLNTAASYAGLLLAGLGLGTAGFANFATEATVLLDQADTLAPQFLSGGTALPGGLMATAFWTNLHWFLVPAVLVILSLIAQQAIVFAPEKLAPKLSRISPIANAKQKFGREGLFEFAKSAVKLVVISIVLGFFMTSRLPQMLQAQFLTPAMVSNLLIKLIGEFLFLVLIIAGAIGAVDYLWQRSQHIRRNRMSRKELTDEMKDSEGDPHMKQQRRSRAQEIATNQMLADVPKADVIIVNPTHYAVALKWDRATGRPPICVAKGVDEVAARIRAAASEAGVPIHSDPPTARALHASVDIGREIWPDHYQAVAAAIRFAETMRQRAKARRGG